MTKKSLPTMEPGQPALGTETIMNRTLAARHGIPYVHLAVFAIDVDRLRARAEAIEEPEEWPFAWEVFLTEAYLLRWLDPGDEAHLTLVEDACLGIMELGPGAAPYGAQLPFAVYDAWARGAWSVDLGPLFEGWKGRASSMVDELATLWEHGDAQIAELARDGLAMPLDPPPAEPTIHALQTLAEHA